MVVEGLAVAGLASAAAMGWGWAAAGWGWAAVGCRMGKRQRHWCSWKASA